MNTNEQGMLYGLYGSYVNKSKVIGYCKHHRAALTARTLKCHECLNKQCHALQKYENHDFWRQRAQKKELRKARKQMLCN